MISLEGIRSLSEDSRPEWAIRDMTKSPLILIKKEGRNSKITYAKNKTDKDRLVEQFDEKKDILLFSWCGEWSTDVFKLSKYDVDNYYLKGKYD